MSESWGLTRTRRGGKFYYRARGFGTYYFVNAVFNIVQDRQNYLRGIEDILGDARTAWFAEPFKMYTNLHEFARSVLSEILLEDIHLSEASLDQLSSFLKRYEVPVSVEHYADDRDALCDILWESDELGRALEELTDEVFHVLFNDVAFLKSFNELVASYIAGAELQPSQISYVTKKGTLRRASIPAWVQKAIFHRDKGSVEPAKKAWRSRSIK